MKLSDVKFYKSVGLETSEIMFDAKNEVVFVWRSNVGKSSIMNALFEKKDLVKTSSRPGKTKLANIFTVANKYYMTDLPGYGFAKLGKNLKEALEGLISWYLEERTTHLKKVVILIDSKLGENTLLVSLWLLSLLSNICPQKNIIGEKALAGLLLVFVIYMFNILNNT